MSGGLGPSLCNQGRALDDPPGQEILIHTTY